MKYGDRVRLDGKVTHLPAHLPQVAEIQSDDGHYHMVHTASLEVIQTVLPTTPGSIVRNNYKGSLWVLGHDGWRPTSDGAAATGWVFGAPQNYTVVFDAGVE